ncbi:MAG TPA: pantoate--beta-alanine ligase [Chryseolinea sp.]|nr:pantoate--beta-alanine ligase [Chryseolinea sp.]
MEIFKKIAPLKVYLEEIRRSGKTIGLVPTMGALHNGHLALIGESKAQNSYTICSIYVNPMQFNNPADLQKYPRTLDQDIKLLSAAGCDAIFCPDNDEMYEGKSVLKFDFGDSDKVMEGKYRPGHFSGVALVVSKLFNIVNPNNAYFGQKDWQQFAVIQQVVLELKFGLTLHSIPTLRETDGLAMSSRNLRLNGMQRQQATTFYNALRLAKENLKKGEEIASVKRSVKKIVEGVEGVTLEYFEVAESSSLDLLEAVDGAKAPILCIAGYVGEIRLIDNMFLN